MNINRISSLAQGREAAHTPVRVLCFGVEKLPLETLLRLTQGIPMMYVEVLTSEAFEAAIRESIWDVLLIDTRLPLRCAADAARTMAAAYPASTIVLLGDAHADLPIERRYRFSKDEEGLVRLAARIWNGDW